MSDVWTGRLSEFLDGELSAAEREVLEAHLQGCAECAATLEELRRVVARARSLEDRPLPGDLWPAVAERIGAFELDAQPARAGSVRRVSFTLPQLIAAGIALVVLSGGGVWLAQWRAARHPTRIASGTLARLPANFATQYDAEVASLEQALATGRGRLDTNTVRVLETNLETIRAATLDARRALESDPANPYLREYLERNMKRKLDLLKRATMVASLQ